MAICSLRLCLWHYVVGASDWHIPCSLDNNADELNFDVGGVAAEVGHERTSPLHQQVWSPIPCSYIHVPPLLFFGMLFPVMALLFSLFCRYSRLRFHHIVYKTASGFRGIGERCRLNRRYFSIPLLLWWADGWTLFWTWTESCVLVWSFGTCPVVLTLTRRTRTRTLWGCLRKLVRNSCMSVRAVPSSLTPYQNLLQYQFGIRWCWTQPSWYVNISLGVSILPLLFSNKKNVAGSVRGRPTYFKVKGSDKDIFLKTLSTHIFSSSDGGFF